MGLFGGKKNENKDENKDENAVKPECFVCGKPVKGKFRGGKKGNVHPKCVTFAASEYKSIHEG